VFGAIFRPPATKREERKIVGASLALLEQIGLTEQKDELARHLPYGAQRRLEIARALATDPQLLLLDEPAAGLNLQETVALETLIHAIRSDGVSILLIEHDMKLVMRLADRIFVLENGRKIAEGTPDAVRHNPAVIKAYLGEDVDNA
jgi:branched-chain amino acid transport system ATP-binding protein